MAQGNVNPAAQSSARASGETGPQAARSGEGFPASPVQRAEHGEPRMTRLLEQQTAKLPSSTFLAASLGAMAVSLVAELMDRPRLSRFVGMWASTLLIMGVYNKIVKQLGPR